MAKRTAPEYPQDIAEDWAKLAELNPAYRPENADPRVAREIALLQQNPADLPPDQQRGLIRELRLIQISFRSRIAQLLDNPEWMQRGVSTEQEWRAAPRTIFKTMEEVFSHPVDRMVIQRGERVNAQKLVVVDPLRLSDSLLKNLGLKQYAAKTSKRRQSEEQKLLRRAEAIPEIPEIIGNLEPFLLPSEEIGGKHLRYFRLMRVARGRHRGMLLGTENVNSEKTLFLTDLFGEQRRLLHIEKGYAEEIEKLKFLQAVVEDVRNRLDEWSDIQRSGETLELSGRLSECIESLKYVKDAHKRNLRARLEKCFQFHDATGRPNPSAAQAALTAALKDLAARLRDIEGIWAYIGRDKTRVAETIAGEKIAAECRTVFEDKNGGVPKKTGKSFLEIAETMHENFSVLRQNPPMSEDEKRKVFANLRGMKACAARLKFEPFATFGWKWGEQIDITVAALRENQNEAVAKEFTKIYLLAKVFRCWMELQEMYTDISVNPEKVDARQLLERMQKINDKLSERVMAQTMRTPEYDALYGKVYHLLNHIKKALREYLEQQQTKSQTIPFTSETGAAETQKKTTEDTVISDLIKHLSRLPFLGSRIQEIKNRVDAFLEDCRKRYGGRAETPCADSREGQQEPPPVAPPIDSPEPAAPESAETTDQINPAIAAIIQDIKEQIRNFSFPALLHGSL